MAETPKLNVAPLLTAPLAFARTGYQVSAEAASKYAVADKFSAVKDHKVVAQINSQKEVLLALLGLALVLHGSQFKNILLCTQVVLAFLYERVRRSIDAILSDITAAQEKLKADGGDKKEASKGKAGAEKQKEDAEVTMKALKALSSEKLSAAAVEVLASGLACVLVVHGGVAQTIAVSYALVNLVADKVEGIIEFPGYEDIKSWTSLLVRLALYAVVIPIALVAAPLALALDAAACGAKLATEHGAKFLAAKGKVEDADKFLGSKKGLLTVGGLMAFGTLWQFWSLASGGGLAWYFTLMYFPAVIVEALLGLM